MNTSILLHAAHFPHVSYSIPSPDPFLAIKVTFFFVPSFIDFPHPILSSTSQLVFSFNLLQFRKSHFRSLFNSLSLINVNFFFFSVTLGNSYHLPQGSLKNQLNFVFPHLSLMGKARQMGSCHNDDKKRCLPKV